MSVMDGVSRPKKKKNPVSTDVLRRVNTLGQMYI